MSEELIKISKNGQWELLQKSKLKVRKFGDYTVHSKSAGYTDTDTGGEGAEPRDVYSHKIYHKGKHIGEVHTADADGKHINIGWSGHAKHDKNVDDIVDKL